MRPTSAPARVALQVTVNDGSGGNDYLLPYPCMLANGEWVTAVSGSALAVHPTYWKLWVETPRGREHGRRLANRGNSRGFADRRPSGKRMRHIIE